MLVPTDGSGAFVNLTPDNLYGDDFPHFTPDGRSVLYTRVATANSQGELRRLWRVSLGDRKAAPLTAALDLSIDDVAFSADGRQLWLQAEDNGVVPVFAMDADGGAVRKVVASGSNTELDSAEGQLVFLGETTSRAPEVFALDPGGQPRQLTRFNDTLFAGLDLGKVESHTFPGAGGDKVQAWVVYPAGDEGLIHHSDRGVQYVSIRYSERLAEAGIEPSVGSVGDSYDNALAETINGLYKAEVIHRRSWRNLEAVELATLDWVDWFNHKRLLGPIGNIPPAEAEAVYHQQQRELAMAA